MREIPKLRNMILPAGLIIAIFILQWGRSNQQVPYWRYEGAALGTTYTVQIIHPERIPDAVITQTIESVNASMSTYIPDSELNRLSAHPQASPFPLSPMLAEVLRAAKSVSEQSRGAFDVTVAPLVNAWGFGPEGRRTTPSPDLIQTLREECGDALWRIDAAGVTKVKDQVKFDLSAIAKGYAVDEVARQLSKQGIKRYWVEIGGEVSVLGLNREGQPWKVGIERPAGEDQRRILKVISLRDTTIATSGDYRNRYLDDQGVMRSHTIDPRTGFPIKHNLASVSVLHPQNMYADAWATALNVLGAEAGLEVANKYNLAVIFVHREGQVASSLTPDTEKTRYKLVMSLAMKKYMEGADSRAH